MPARIDTKKDVICDHDDLLTWMESPICISDPDQFSEFLELFTIKETATLIKPEANSLEQFMIDHINETIETSYMMNGYTDGMDALKSTVRDILKDVSGIMPYHTDTYQFYTDHRFIIEELLDVADMKPTLKRDGSFEQFYDQLAWTAIELTVINLMDECGVEV